MSPSTLKKVTKKASVYSLALKPCPPRASALTLGQCLAVGMTLTLDVGYPDVNQCGLLEVSTLPLTLGVGRP